MNSIQSMARADFYNDVTRSGRFYFSDYNKAFNDAISLFIDGKLGDEQQRDPENFQWIQGIRDDLYNLITVASPTVTVGTPITNKYYTTTVNHIVFPTDYYDFVTLNCLIGGFTNYSRPTDYNQRGPLLQDSFRHPVNDKTYFLEDSTGLTVLAGPSGTFTSMSLTYIKTPATFSVGAETQLIGPGVTLTNAVSYIAVEISVQNSITYQIGDQFTAVGTTLTSGLVIAAANTVSINLPDKVHDDICKAASRIMLKVTSNYQAAEAVESEAQKGLINK